MEEQVLDFEVTENIGILLDSEIILYGTASQAERLYPLIQKVELNVAGCCDGSHKKIGKTFHGFYIESFSDVVNKINVDNVIILICSTFVKEIIEDCRRVCGKNLCFVTPYGFQTAFVLNRENPKMKLEFREWYNQQYDMWFNIQRENFISGLKYSYTKRLIRMMQSDEVFVYQTGKVGSSSVAKSLSAAGIGNMHVHYFYPFMNGISSQDFKEYFDKLQQIIGQKNKIKISTFP